MTDHLDEAELQFNAMLCFAPEDADGSRHPQIAMARGMLAIVRHLRASQPATETAGSEDSTPMDRSGSAFWIVELESTDENDPGWFANSGGAGDDKITGYYLREEAERAGAESVGLGYRWRVKWVAPANRKSSPGEDNAVRHETPAETRARLGWAPLSEEQKAANLAHNLGTKPDPQPVEGVSDEEHTGCHDSTPTDQPASWCTICGGFSSLGSPWRYPKRYYRTAWDRTEAERSSAAEDARIRELEQLLAHETTRRQACAANVGDAIATERERRARVCEEMAKGPARLTVAADLVVTVLEDAARRIREEPTS